MSKGVGRLANAMLTSFKEGKSAQTLKASAWLKYTDGNLGASHQLKPLDKVVGQDEHGNVYLEDMSTQYGRHRWVLYSNHEDYFDGPSSIPAKWHGWIHHINDAKGDEMDKQFPAPKYAAAAAPTKTGYSDQDYYVPKGHWRHPATRGWKKYSAWSPK